MGRLSHKNYLIVVVSHNDRRACPRIAVASVEVEVYSPLGDRSPPDTCSVVDLSESGMQFVANRAHDIKQDLRLTFLLPRTDIPIRTDAVVIHQVSASPLRTGVRFRDLGMAERRLLRCAVRDMLGPGRSKAHDHVNPEPGKTDCLSERRADPEWEHMDSANLVSGCIGGDKRSQRLLFARYRDSVHNLVVRTLGPGHDIDDIIQQVFIRLFRSLSNFKGLSSLDTWVYRIAVKVCTDQLRKKYRKRQLRVVQGSEAIDRYLDRSSNDPHGVAEHKELTAKIYEGLGRLSHEKRLAIVLFEMHDLSVDRIAEIVQTPVGTVKSRLFHGRRELARYLRQYVESDQ